MSHHDATDGTEGRAKLTGTRIVDFEKPLDLSVLKDRIALVTGGVAGIGLGVVNALVEAGAWVAICDLNEQAGREVEAELVGKGYKYVAFDCWKLPCSYHSGLYRADPGHF
jgi:NAD(P)-dependent dehydrogenase (short-subunit alcohol dehydrogenase family)